MEAHTSGGIQAHTAQVPVADAIQVQCGSKEPGANSAAVAVQSNRQLGKEMNFA